MESESATKACFACGGLYPDISGPVHRYMSSSPGCWAVYGEVLSREYSDLGYFAVHRLTVDAYAVQHPGGDDRQSIQSVGLHLVRLCAMLEHGLQPEHADAAMRRATRIKHTFHRLTAPPSLGALTAADVAEAGSPEAHRELVRAWAESAWQAWAPHHETVRTWMSGAEAAG